MPVSAEVATLFLDELARRNIEVKLDDEGNYTLDAYGLSIKVSLENVSRDFECDRDADRIVTFVDSITNLLVLPDWQEAKGRIRWQPEPSDHKFGDTLRDAVSDKVSLVLVYADPSDTQIRWLTAADAEKWNKTRTDLMTAAQENMDRILRQTKIETALIEEHQLGMLSNELIAFKAAPFALSEFERRGRAGARLAALCRDAVPRFRLSAQSEGPAVAWPDGASCDARISRERLSNFD
jgi:hypothetical protein